MRRVETSSLDVQYDLRPAKQIERRMIVDGLRLLEGSGFPIREYRYTGMGSLHFVDFVMFHKLLGIKKLRSFEHSPKLARRVNFNKPFECVGIEIGPIGDAIPNLNRDEKHILWLDYDSVLSRTQLEDIWQATSLLSVGSLLLVTVDLKAPGDDPKEWKSYYEKVARSYVRSRPAGAYVKSKLTRVNVDIVSQAMSSGVSSRRGVDVLPLFSFTYADGHRMLSMGCMIGTSVERRLVRESAIVDQVYYRGSFAQEPYEIRVPVVTRRERLQLDAAMPCADSWAPRDFDLAMEDIHTYREVYRFLPAYAELLL